MSMVAVSRFQLFRSVHYIANGRYTGIEAKHLLVFGTGVITEMHVWENYAFHIRCPESCRPTCLAFYIQRIIDFPDPDRHIVRVHNAVVNTIGDDPVDYNVISRVVISKEQLDAMVVSE
ncbi:uncharacterized protein MELLADRAFT_110866 [Melampsora larici-populina 98AG31]|uniref:Uncharacterized protein n=1 Tax=Melampsora larici-populina (strain 98AG31 / pathotype 3-4-7) TaxID=747676 RepID=F4S190_MELLP|nr:uncharacterized protein MELLADRAFT_110866 [Melampsora larici-populina 98AG31]EGG01604.1 hypothetical protein MELLADRAFT_110866 [Melampsora larici-populina 98AG31]